MNQKQRKQFKFEGRVIYEWEQSLDALTIYIECPLLPPNIKKSNIFSIKITPDALEVGIKDNPPYLKHSFKGIADSVESLWLIQTNAQTKKQQIVVQIQKAQKGVRWGSVFKGHQGLNPLEQESLKKKLMLERFQQEHPGFDFSDAEFNGQVPEARDFMGGMKSV